MAILAGLCYVPGLEKLRDVAYAGAIDVLYVHSPDRLARKYAYQVLLIDEFKKATSKSCSSSIITDTPEDELLLQVQGMISEYERAKILERSRRGKRMRHSVVLSTCLAVRPMVIDMFR